MPTRGPGARDPGGRGSKAPGAIRARRGCARAVGSGVRDGKGTQRRRGAKIAVGATVAVLVLAGAWVGAHVLRSAPAPHWSDADLPPLPPAEENGWEQLRVRGFRAELEEPWNRLAGEGAEALWAESARTLGARAAIAAHREDAEAILALPRFVDACPARLSASCPTLEVLALIDVAALIATGHAHEGEWEEAIGSAARLVDRMGQLAASGRLLVTRMLGVVALREALSVALAVARHTPVEVDLSALEGALELDEAAIELAPAFVGEYLFFRSAMEESREQPLLIDRAQTDAMAVRLYGELRAFAEEPPAGPRPSREPYSEGPLWWVYNAGGKEMLDLMMAGDMTTLVDRYRDERAAMLEERDALRARLEAHAEARVQLGASRGDGPGGGAPGGGTGSGEE